MDTTIVPRCTFVVKGENFMTGMTMKYLNRLHRAMATESSKYLIAYHNARSAEKYQRMSVFEVSEYIKTLSKFKGEVISGKIHALREVKYEKQMRNEALKYESLVQAFV